MPTSHNSFVPIPRFVPNEVLTADRLNRIVDAINAFNDRLAALEGPIRPAARRRLQP